MKLDSALNGVQRLYIDTAPFIYYVEDYPIYADLMNAIFSIVNTGSIEVITSVITLSETLTKPLKTGDRVVEQTYRTLLRQTRNVTLAPINIAIAERAADIRSRYNLRTPDALHIATTLETRCHAFLTNDKALQRIKELPVLVLDEIESEVPPSANN